MRSADQNQQFKVLPATTGAIAAMFLIYPYDQNPGVIIATAAIGACIGFVLMPFVRAVADFCRKAELRMDTAEYQAPRDGREHPPIR